MEDRLLHPTRGLNRLSGLSGMVRSPLLLSGLIGLSGMVRYLLGHEWVEWVEWYAFQA